MKRNVAILSVILALLVLVLPACSGQRGNDGTMQIQGERSAPPTANEIINAFAKAGYLYEIYDSTIDEFMSENGVTSFVNYQLIRQINKPEIIDNICDFCELHYFEFSDTQHAEMFFNMMLSEKNSEGDLAGSFVQVEIPGGKKAVAHSSFWDKAVYGTCSMVIRLKNTVVMLNIDWDDYKDVSDYVGVQVEYDHLPEEIMTGLGY